MLQLHFEPIKIAVSDAGSTSGLVVDDLNNDGKPDVAVNQFASGDVFVLPNTSSGGVLSFGDVVTLSVSGNLLGLACGDINEDNKPDLVVTDIITNKVSILLNESNGNIAFSSPKEFSTGSQPWGIGLLDFSGNNKLDIIATSVTGDSYTFFLNKFATHYADTIHLNGLGYAAMAEEWHDILDQ